MALPNDVPMLLSVARAARLSGISRSQLYRAIETGHLLARKVGSKWRILRDDLIAYILALPIVGEASE